MRADTRAEVPIHTPTGTAPESAEYQCAVHAKKCQRGIPAKNNEIPLRKMSQSNDGSHREPEPVDGQRRNSHHKYEPFSQMLVRSLRMGLQRAAAFGTNAIVMRSPNGRIARR